jgi:vacuolar-type H+-ATPase subunit H
MNYRAITLSLVTVGTMGVLVGCSGQETTERPPQPMLAAEDAQAQTPNNIMADISAAADQAREDIRSATEPALEEVSKKIDELRGEMAEASEDARAEMQVQLAELEKQAEELRKKIAEETSSQ